MVEQFENFIQEHRLCCKKDKILVAMSGGVDSSVMLDLFLRNGYKVGIAHCNFGLRGKESDLDKQFIVQLARRRRLSVYVERFDTASFAGERGISIQMAARELRYAWFDDIREKKGYQWIATGHNLNDSVETILFNLLRGTGLRGLTGIPVKTNQVIRPLLYASRKDIEAYAEEKRIAFRTDSSNLSNKYQRNFIRHRILPAMLKLNPGFMETVKHTIEKLEGPQRFMESWLHAQQSSYLEIRGKDIYLKKRFFQEIGEPVLLHEVLRPYGFNFEQSKVILEDLDHASGGLFYSGDHVLNNDRSFLIISPLASAYESFTILENDREVITAGFRLKIEHFSATKYKLDIRSTVGSFDMDKVRFPLMLSTWEKGDWFIPLGMKGKKKLSDFMIDKKIPLNLKERIMVLRSGDSIMWVVGHRIDERFKIDGATRNVLKITYLQLND